MNLTPTSKTKTSKQLVTLFPLANNRIILLFLLVILPLTFTLPGCSSTVESTVGDQPPVDDQPGDSLPEWLIPSDEVFDGGPGRDGIPALVFPEVVDQASINYLNDDDLIVAIRVGDVVRGYPHPILDWHEIVNDSIGNLSFAITYCPLTGSAIGWNRTLNGQVTTFGVSGLLYNTNLIPYDRATQSNWSQMRNQCVNGELVGDEPELIPLIETSWATFKEMYPEAGVLSTNTGVNRRYGSYPYEDYRTNDQNMLFPVPFDDERMPAKWRVLGVATEHSSKVFPIKVFLIGTTVLNETFDQTNFVVAGSNQSNFIVAYNSTLPDGTTLTFRAIQNQLPIIMSDNEGSSYDIFGKVVAGPRLGTQLTPLDTHIAYWFAWLAFHPGAASYAR